MKPFPKLVILLAIIALALIFLSGWDYHSPATQFKKHFLFAPPASGELLSLKQTYFPVFIPVQKTFVYRYSADQLTEITSHPLPMYYGWRKLRPDEIITLFGVETYDGRTTANTLINEEYMPGKNRVLIADFNRHYLIAQFSQSPPTYITHVP